MVSQEQFQTNQTDVQGDLTNIKAVNPDVILPHLHRYGSFDYQASPRTGNYSQDYGRNTWENVTIIENAGADAEGIVLSTFFDEAEPATDEAKSFIRVSRNTWSRIINLMLSPAVSALGYDAYLAILTAIKKCRFC